MKDYQIMAKEIILNVGGKKNINEVMHCVTRLRFNLVDDSIAKKDKIKAISGVMDIQNRGGQYQVIIGTDVEEVYQEVINQLGISNQEDENSATNANSNKSKKSFGKIFNSMLDTFSSIIVKPMYAIAGAGILRGLLYMFVSLKWISAESTTYQFFDMLGDSLMYFMPFMLAVSAAKKFKTNEYLALAIACFMFAPKYMATLSEGATPLGVFGFDVPAISYTSSIIPIILAVWIMSYLNRYLEKYVPKVLSLFVTPLIVLVIMAPVTFFVIGPIGAKLGDGLGSLLQMLFDNAPWVAGIIIGGARPLLVIVGMHHAIRPITYQQLATYGYNLISPLNFISTMSQATASLASYFVAKDKEVKSLALSSALSGYVGITEPALYGVLVRLQRPLLACIIGGGIGGAYVALNGVMATTHAMSSVFTIPIFFGETFKHLVIGLIISTIITFVLTIIFGASKSYREQEKNILDKVASANVSDLDIASPVKGELISLSAVNDVAFSNSEVGQGVGIIPIDGKVFAPCNGIVKMVFPTKHAIGIISDGGAELLIHFGINTVNLAGEGFRSFVEVDQKVKQGDLLMEVDLDLLNEKGYDSTVILIIENAKKIKQMIKTDGKSNVMIGDTLFYVGN